MSDESRKKILARRASFVAAALAGVACGKDAEAPPQPCLSQVYVPEEAFAGSIEPPSFRATSVTVSAPNVSRNAIAPRMIVVTVPLLLSTNMK